MMAWSPTRSQELLEPNKQLGGHRVGDEIAEIEGRKSEQRALIKMKNTNRERRENFLFSFQIKGAAWKIGCNENWYKSRYVPACLPTLRKKEKGNEDAWTYLLGKTC